MTVQRIFQGNAEMLTRDDGLFSEFDQPVKLVLTDPPYGVNFVSRRAATPEGKKWVRPVAADATLAGAIELFNDVMDGLLPRCDDEAELYVFTRWDIVDEWIRVVRGLDRHGFKYKMLLVWDKGIPGMGDIDSNWGCGHELVLYCKKGLRLVPKRRSSIVAVDKVHTSRAIHPTEKPVALLEEYIKMSTDPGDLVVDPFAGSGSTLEACLRTGRNGLGFELDPMYVDRIQNRLTQDTLF